MNSMNTEGMGSVRRWGAMSVLLAAVLLGTGLGTTVRAWASQPPWSVPQRPDSAFVPGLPAPSPSASQETDREDATEAGDEVFLTVPWQADAVLPGGNGEFCGSQPSLVVDEAEVAACVEPYARGIEAALPDLWQAPMHRHIRELLYDYILNPRAVRSVERNLRVFSEDIRDSFALYLSRSGRYVPLMKRILREEGIPEDIVFLPLVESGFNTRAYSRSRAAGPWQFIAGTARRYGLTINWWVDERRDPVKSTRAAARYLKDLYGMFNSWSLALAAYNAGEGKVRRAITRTRSDDYWHLVTTRYLRRETKNYVPKYIAARTIALAPESFGFGEIDYHEELAFDEATVRGALSLDVAARCAGTTVAVLRELNPELRRSSTPPNKDGYTLRIPEGTQERFLTRLAQVPESERFTLKTYRVRRGDTVSEIARKTGVPARAIISYNRLGRRALIRAGQRLLLPVPLSSGSFASLKVEDLPTITLQDGRTVREYRVRRGDTVSGIARKTGVSVRDIVKMNSLRNSSRIHVGQRLLLPLD